MVGEDITGNVASKRRDCVGQLVFCVRVVLVVKESQKVTRSCHRSGGAL